MVPDALSTTEHSLAVLWEQVTGNTTWSCVFSPLSLLNLGSCLYFWSKSASEVPGFSSFHLSTPLSLFGLLNLTSFLTFNYSVLSIWSPSQPPACIPSSRSSSANPHIFAGAFPNAFPPEEWEPTLNRLFNYLGILWTWSNWINNNLVIKKLCYSSLIIVKRSNRELGKRVIEASPIKKCIKISLESWAKYFFMFIERVHE